MLIDFTVENYRSIKDSITFTMEATAIKDHSENIFDDGKKTLLKSAVIYGPNASGKSNLLNAMNFMRHFIENSATEYKQNDTIGIESFELNSHTENQPSLFEATFVHNKIKYRYGFRLDNNLVHDEWLFYTPNIRETKLFIRTGQEFDLSTAFSEGRLIVKENKTRVNALFLSVVAQFNGDISNDISNWFKQFNITSNVDKNKFEHYTHDMLSNSESKYKILQLLLSVDMGIKDVEMKIRDVEYEEVPSFIQKMIKDDKAEKSKITQSEIITKHMQYNEKNEYIKDIEFKLKKESTGTKKFLLLAGPIVETLENGEILVIDELDNSFHTQMTEFIIKLFNSKETNPNNAQLIFATHDTNLLTHKLFRRDQIWFVEKNIYGESEIFSLIDFGARKDTSLEKNYLEGKFGGVPHIYNLYAESIDNGN
ncbi:ATP-binding protein [Sulfurimonas sp. HSL3-2]|uniref:AAA family ATPase n=1 Tax=Hydrocurvibacter mobilis TaxID=3131936 RepID=UPI0031F92831